MSSPNACPGGPFSCVRAIILFFVPDPSLQTFWRPVSYSTRFVAERVSRGHSQAFGQSSSFPSPNLPWLVFGPTKAMAHVSLPNACPGDILNGSGYHPRFHACTPRGYSPALQSSRGIRVRENGPNVIFFNFLRMVSNGKAVESYVQLFVANPP